MKPLAKHSCPAKACYPTLLSDEASRRYGAESLSSLWITGTLHHETKGACKSMKNQSDTPLFTHYSGEKKRLKSEFKSVVLPVSKEKKKPRGKIAKNHLAAKHIKERPKIYDSPECSKRNKISLVNRMDKCFEVYQTQSRASAPLRQYRKKRREIAPEIKDPMESTALTQLLQIKNDETASAYLIQRARRCQLSRRTLVMAYKKLTASKTLQEQYRRYRCRQSIARRISCIQKARIKCQRCMLMAISNIHLGIQQQLEHVSAVKIQSIVRRIPALWMRVHLYCEREATKIQSIWKRFDAERFRFRLKRYRAASRIQAICRGKVTRPMVERRRKAAWKAADVIAGCGRSFLSRLAIGSALATKRRDQHVHSIQMLTADRAYYSTCLDRAEKRREQLNLSQNLNVKEDKLYQLMDSLDKQEAEYAEAKIEFDGLQVSDMAMRYDTVLEDRIVEGRKKITQLKLSIIFGVGQEVANLKENIMLSKKRCTDLAETVRIHSRWRDEEVNALRRTQIKTFKDTADRDLKRRTFDERQKWRWIPTTPSGKPLKKSVRNSRVPPRQSMTTKHINDLLKLAEQGYQRNYNIICAQNFWQAFNKCLIGVQEKMPVVGPQEQLPVPLTVPKPQIEKENVPKKVKGSKERKPVPWALLREAKEKQNHFRFLRDKKQNID